MDALGLPQGFVASVLHSDPWQAWARGRARLETLFPPAGFVPCVRGADCP